LAKIYKSENDFRFSKFLVKIAKKCGCYIFRKTLKNLACTQSREIRRNQVISAHANSNRTFKKFLVAFSNENLFVNPATKGHFLGMSAYLKISGQPPAAIFASPIDTKKLIKAEGLILVKLSRVSIQIQKGCYTFQLPLVYNRVCWGGFV
jgi:hypothetical protein